MTQDYGSPPPAPSFGGAMPPASASAPPPWWNTPPNWMTLVPRRRSTIRRILTGVMVTVFILSVVTNGYLMAILATQMERRFEKSVITPGNDDQIVAVYSLAGVVDSDMADSFHRFCREVGKDSAVKAVVLRVVSPGGTVTASDEIFADVQGLKEAGKKIVVSMGSMAASGGYYISSPADEIFAEPTSITGSIGVIAEWMIFKGTLDKIGAESVVIKSTHARGWKDEMGFLKKPDDRQMQHLQSILDQMQERFEKVVRDGRGSRLHTQAKTYALQVDSGGSASKPATVQQTETEPFNGKIYLADEAKTLGLIDEIGYQPAAVERAAKLANLSSAKVVQYQQRHGMLDMLLGEKSSAAQLLDRKVLEEIQTPRIMMLWRAE